MNSGIYIILCTKTNDIYVGSTTDYSKRVTAHRSNIKLGKVSGLWSELAFKYGLESFKFTLIENIDSSICMREREQFWINALHPTLNQITADQITSEFIPPKTTASRRRILSLVNDIINRSDQETLISILTEHGYSKQTLYNIASGSGSYVWFKENYPIQFKKLLKSMGRSA